MAFSVWRKNSVTRAKENYKEEGKLQEAQRLLSMKSWVPST